MLPPLEERYERTRDALKLFETSLLSLSQRRAEYGPNFHFDAVQVVEEIFNLRAQIDDIIGLTAFVKEFGLPPDPDAPTGGPAVPTAEPAAVE